MKRIFAIPILIFLAFIGFLYLALPQIISTSKAKKDFSKAEQDLKSRQQYFEDLKASIEELDSYKVTLEKIEASLSGELSVASLIDFFNKKADDNGLTLKTLVPTVSSKQEDLGAKKEFFQYFQLSLSGTISSFKIFLKDIETSARLVDVENITIQKAGGDNNFNIAVSLKVYY